MDRRPEVAVVPVTDVDESRDFYGTEPACRLHAEGRSHPSYASFSDPDGNGWRLQEITERLHCRV